MKRWRKPTYRQRFRMFVLLAAFDGLRESIDALEADLDAGGYFGIFKKGKVTIN